MKSLKILAAPLALAAGLALAVPAQAQHYRQESARTAPVRTVDFRQNAHFRQDIASLNKDIDRASARRTISQREARKLRQDVRSIERLYASYARSGLSRPEARSLDARVKSVRIALRAERNDRNRFRG